MQKKLLKISSTLLKTSIVFLEESLYNDAVQIRNVKLIHSMLPIKKITIRHCRLNAKYRGNYTSGEKDPPEIISFIVEISDTQCTGFGECIPTSLYYPQGHAGRSNIDEWKELCLICSSLIGHDAFRLGCLLPNRLKHETDYLSIYDAVDFALHDLIGRCLHIPASVLLGGVRRKEVWAVPVIHTDSPENMAEWAYERHKEYGFRFFKLKPVGNLQSDTETLRKISEKCGDIKFFMDANYALRMSCNEVISYINELSKYGLIAYEDPIEADFDTYRSMKE